MHAIRQYEFGPPSTLQYEEVDDPHPAEGQVRIAVACTSSPTGSPTTWPSP